MVTPSLRDVWLLAASGLTKVSAMPDTAPGSRPSSPTGSLISRRLFIKGAAGAAIAIAASPYLLDGSAFASLGTGTTPEQVHLQWGPDPATSVVVSWAAPNPEADPQVSYGTSLATMQTVPATTKTYTDGLNGETVYTYHASLTGLTPDTTYIYVVSDGAAPTPNTYPQSSFTTAPTGRSGFSFTSFGDLATPGLPFSTATWGESQYNAFYAVNEVEALGPLFHLMNGDLAYADKAPTASGAGNQPQPEVWRDYGNNVQRSAANRPWMPCIGNHESELGVTQYNRAGYSANENAVTFTSALLAAGAGVYSGGSFPQYANGMYGHASYLTRFMLPDNGTAFPGSFYSFQVGSVLFISLDAADVAYQDSGGFTANSYLTPSGVTLPANTGVYNRQYTGALGAPNTDNTIPAGSNAQTQWLETTLQNAAASASVDWIIVQMHQPALSSAHDNGSDLGIRQAWLPLFDKYQVDLVVCGHDHEYERSFPVRGFNHDQGTGLPATTATTLQSTTTVPPTPGSPIAGTGASGSLRAGQSVDTLQPCPVASATISPTEFDTSQGTVHLVLGGGGTNAPDNLYGAYGYGLQTVIDGVTVPAAGVVTYTNPKIVATANKGLPDSWEPAIWSAKNDPGVANASDKSNGVNAYGVALFTVDPGDTPGGTTTITLDYYHTSQVSASGSPPVAPVAPTYTLLESIRFTRPRSDGTTPPRTDVPEFSSPVLGVAAAAAVGAGALYLGSRSRAGRAADPAVAGAATDD
jgi:alkaline phosphatase D